MREQVFPLTLMEMKYCRYLIEHEGKPVSRKTMLEESWGLHEDTDTRAIDNFIVRLRRYIEDDPTKPAAPAHGARCGVPGLWRSRPRQPRAVSTRDSGRVRLAGFPSRKQ